MTQDDVIRLARKADIHAPGGPNWGPFIASLERFATLVISDFLARSGQYVTNDASREAVMNAGRLEGWQAAREQSATICEGALSFTYYEPGEGFAKAIRAMQPPAEWGDIGKSVSESQESLCKTCARANVSCPVYPLDTQHCVEHVAMPKPFTLSTEEMKAAVGEEDFRKEPKWPHPDGFADGLTERNDDGQD